MAIAAPRSSMRARPLAVLLLLSITLIVLDRTITGPTDWLRSAVQDSFAAAGSGVNRVWPFGASNEVQVLQAENQALRQQLQTAQGSLFQVQDQARQLNSLTNLLNLQTPGDLDRVVAQVTAANTANFDSSIELSKGTNDGIRVGMPAMTGAGLVGRVVQTSSTRSTVLLITDSTFELGIRFGSVGEVAVAVGQGTGNSLRADLVDLDSQIAEGAVAVTNGQQNSLFPPGIPVATVASSNATNQDLRRNVQLTPTADMNHLDAVAVLLWTPA